MPTSGAQLATGCWRSEGSCTAGAGGIQCTALWDFSFLPWERLAAIRYDGVVMEYKW